MTGLHCLGLSVRLRFRTWQGLTLSPHGDGLENRQTVPHLEANFLGRKGTTFGPILNFCRSSRSNDVTGLNINPSFVAPLLLKAQHVRFGGV